MMYKGGLFQTALRYYHERHILWTRRPQGNNLRNHPWTRRKHPSPKKDEQRGHTRVPGAAQS